jgi:ubiquitin C-terminal hydrolase
MAVRRNGFDGRFTFTIQAEREVELPFRSEHGAAGSVSYTLGGVILHAGSQNAGHYRALVKESDGDWYLYDDSNVVRQTGGQEEVFRPLNAAKEICVLRYDRVGE